MVGGSLEFAIADRCRLRHYWDRRPAPPPARYRDLPCRNRNSTLRIENDSVKLKPGDMAIIDPGEAHTFMESSADYLHFVIHSPSLSPVEHQQERIAVPRSRLGL